MVKPFAFWEEALWFTSQLEMLYEDRLDVEKYRLLESSVYIISEPLLFRIDHLRPVMKEHLQIWNDETLPPKRLQDALSRTSQILVHCL